MIRCLCIRVPCIRTHRISAHRIRTHLIRVHHIRASTIAWFWQSPDSTRPAETAPSPLHPVSQHSTAVPEAVVTEPPTALPEPASPRKQLHAGTAPDDNDEPTIVRTTSVPMRRRKPIRLSGDGLDGNVSDIRWDGQPNAPWRQANGADRLEHENLQRSREHSMISSSARSREHSLTGRGSSAHHQEHSSVSSSAEHDGPVAHDGTHRPAEDTARSHRHSELFRQSDGRRKKWCLRVPFAKCFGSRRQRQDNSDEMVD